MDAAEKAEAATKGSGMRFAKSPLDPLLLQLVQDYTDGSDLSDKLAKLFQVLPPNQANGAPGARVLTRISGFEGARPGRIGGDHEQRVLRDAQEAGALPSMRSQPSPAVADRLSEISGAPPGAAGLSNSTGDPPG